VDELLIPQLKEVFGSYDLDGAWVDGECWGTTVDYSPMARAAWASETGGAAVPLGPEDQNWHRWLEFHRCQFERYLTHYLDALHAFRPNLEITSNWMYTGFAPRPVTAPIDFVSGDYSAQDSVNTARFEARYIASTGMPWDLMAWGFSWWGDGSTRHRTHKPALHLQQEAAVVLSQGGGFQVYYQPTRSGWFDPTLVEVVGQVADFCRARQSVSHKTETVPQVALLLSATAFYDKTNGVLRAWEGEHSALQGVLHALLEAGHSVDVVAEHQIEGRLEDYPLIVLPEVHALALEFRASLIRYVRMGGRLLSIGAETAQLFEDELGVEFCGSPSVSTDYIQAGEMLGMCEGMWQTVQPVTASVVGWRYASVDLRERGEPAATVGILGEGKIGAIYGPLGTVHLNAHTPQIRRFLKGVVSALFPEPIVEVVGPPCIDVAVRRRGQQLLVHLINTAGMQVTSRYTIKDFIPPIGPIDVRIRLDREPATVRVVPEQKTPVGADWQDGVLTVTLPSLAIHTVVCLA
jgi:hypothetical protein